MIHQKRRHDPVVYKTARDNYIKVFIFLFIIMIIFIIFNRTAYAENFVSYHLSPDTDTKIKLEWTSVPGAQIYQIQRDSGSGYTDIATINVDNVRDPLSYIDEGLQPETTYTYRIRPYADESMEMPLDAVETSAARTTKIIRPYNLKAVFNINTRVVSLTWGHSSLASGSRISRTAGGATTSRDVPEVGAVIEEVYDNSTLRFSVRSLGYEISEPSDKVTVIPIDVPVMNIGYVDSSTVKISWDYSSYNGKFQLERSKWNGSSWGNWTVINGDLSGSGTTDKTEVGGRYRYRLNAKSGSGYSGFSNIAEYDNNLAAPSDLSLTIINTERIDLAWVNDHYNKGNIQIWRKVGGSRSSSEGYELIAVLPHTVSSYSDMLTVVPNTTYHYSINTIDQNNHQSISCNASITSSIPQSPSSLIAYVISSSEIKLMWTDDSNNEKGFKIERYDDTSPEFTEIADVAANTTSFYDDTVMQGKTYIYRIYSYNAAGNSDYSNEVTINSWNTAAPMTLNVTPISSTRLDLSWSYAGNDNYNTIIERKSGIDGTWKRIYTTAAGTVKYSDTGLSANTRYFYRVSKALGIGSSGVTYPNNDTGIGAVTLLRDLTLYAEAADDNMILLYWYGSTSDADTIIERKMPNGSFSPLATAGPSTRRWYDDTGLVPGAYYTYRVKSKTATNESLYSREVLVQNYLLEAPSKLKLTVEPDSAIKLTWEDNSQDETGFEIWRYTYGSDDYMLYATVDKNITTFIDTKVTKGLQYGYMVRGYIAYNDIYSTYTEAVSIGVGMINPPANLYYSYISETEIRLRWTDNSDNEQGFRVERKIGDEGEWNTLQYVSRNQTSCKISDLNPYAKYYLRVRAYGSSEKTDSVSEEILVSTALPSAPSDVTATALAASSVRVNWKDESDNEEGFKIVRRISGGRVYITIATVGQDVTSYYDNSVSAGTGYQYKVIAYNTVGDSESDIANARTNITIRFTDTKSVPWAEEAIENLAGMGIINGVSSTLFAPGRMISRAEFTAIAVRAFKLDTAPVGSLADVKSNKWYYREIMIAENFGIISGDESNRFFPESPITREEMAKIIFKAMEASDRKFNIHENSELEKFIDKDNISPDSVASMATLAGEGVIEGLQDNIIGPKYAATRAQAAVIVYRALIKSEPGDE